MKITPKILSIPPYLSTTWMHIRALYLKEKTLVVTLADGVVISIPDLSEQDLLAIFSAHSAFLETQTQKREPSGQTPFHLFHGMPNNGIGNAAGGVAGAEQGALRFSLDNMETLSSALQHNSSQSSFPDFPSEVLDKIASIARIVAPGEIENMPKPEPHCNCPHCQIARAIHGKGDQTLPSSTPFLHQSTPIVPQDKEEITQEDLSFQQWTITQAGDHLFCVINKLDAGEKYNVYLGDPVGCTCGKPGCEHIIAVLKS